MFPIPPLILAGFFCPLGTGALNSSYFCDSPASYCPQGSAARLSTSTGFYAVATTQGLFFNQSVCEPGRYCIGGVAVLCPAGRYGDLPAGTNALCVANCTDGYFCPPGSSRADQQPCGSEAVYCPAVRMHVCEDMLSSAYTPSLFTCVGCVGPGLLHSFRVRTTFDLWPLASTPSWSMGLRHCATISPCAPKGTIASVVFVAYALRVGSVRQLGWPWTRAAVPVLQAISVPPAR